MVGRESHQGDQTSSLLPIWGARLDVIKRWWSILRVSAHLPWSVRCSALAPDLLIYPIRRHGTLKMMLCTVGALQCQN